MKSVMEIFKLATRINIKPKDVIGVGGDIVKMGQSLFNTKVNPKLTEYINKTGKIPDNIMEQIKIHMRSMKNATDSQIELFKLNLKDIVIAQKDLWYVIPLFPMFVIFFISALAETNRPPFDLPEAEAELVAGYQTEYSGMMYAMFWLGEYANILLMCAIGSILFLGGWLPIIDLYPINLIPAPIWMIIKILFLFFLFALIKAIVPRYRYDQLMRLGWKIFLPFSLFYLVLTASFLFYFDKLPKGNF